MAKTFEKDHDEYFLIDQFSSAYQQQYGVANYDEVNWNSREAPWKKQLQKLDEDIYKCPESFKTTIPNPKEKNKVTAQEKLNITNNRI